jgi:hypothetical protein
MVAVFAMVIRQADIPINKHSIPVLDICHITTFLSMIISFVIASTVRASNEPVIRSVLNVLNKNTIFSLTFCSGLN